MKYLRYLWYVIRHKWYVMLECFKYGKYWQGIVHDISKFFPSEFFPYARYFYGDGKARKDSCYSPNSVKNDFDRAWLLHQKRNKHHWQWWVIPKDNEPSIQMLEMELSYVIEMVCDWAGAGRAQGKFSPENDPYKEVRTWYKKNRENMLLNACTTAYVENMIGYGYYDSP